MITYKPEKVYHPIKGMNYDSNGIFMLPEECIDSVNLDFSSSMIKPRAGLTPLVEPNTVEITESVIHYHKYESPNTPTKVFAFCSSKIYLYSGVWQEVSGVTLVGKSLSYWSTVSTIDQTLGTTLVAAGSVVTPLGQNMSNGADRVLLYWSEADTIFKEVDLQSHFPVTEEETTVAIAFANPTVYTIGVTTLGNPNYDANFISMLPGLTQITTTYNGQLATIGSQVYSLAVGKVSLGDPSNGSLVNCYKLIPADDSKVTYGDTSYVRVDGKEFSIKFKDDTHVGQMLLLSYYYNKRVLHKPVCVSSFKNALIYANTYEEGAYFPFRIRWSYQGEIFTTKENSYVDLVEGDLSPILTMMPNETAFYNSIDSYLYIYRSNSIYRANFNSNFALNATFIQSFFNFELAVSIGIASPRTVAPIGRAQVYLGKDDIYIFNGIERESLTLDKTNGSPRVREFIFSLIDVTKPEENFALYNQNQKKYYLFIQPKTETDKTFCFIYDFVFGSWTRYIYPKITAGVISEFIQGRTINQLLEDINSLLGDIDNLSAADLQLGTLLSVGKYPCLVSESGDQDFGMPEPLLDVNGEPILDVNGEIIYVTGYGYPDYYLITRDFLSDNLHLQERIQLVFVEARLGNIDISYNCDYAQTPASFLNANTLEYTTLYKRGQYNLDVVGNNIRFMLKMAPTTETRWMQVFTTEQEMTNI